MGGKGFFEPPKGRKVWDLLIKMNPYKPLKAQSVN